VFATVSEGVLGSRLNWDWWMVDPEDGTLVQIPSEEESGTPSLAPTGDLAIVADARSVWLVDPATGTLRSHIRYPALHTPSEWADVQPRGHRLGRHRMRRPPASVMGHQGTEETSAPVGARR